MADMPEAKAWPACAALEQGHLLLQRAAGGVLHAGVLVLRPLADGVQHVGGRLVDGHRDGAGARVRLLAGVDGAGGEAEIPGIAFHSRASNR